MPSDGARLYYEISGDGELLVLVPAGIADSSMWDGQLAAFARRYRVIRYDMRGFGRSAMVEGPFSHHEDSRVERRSPRARRAVIPGTAHLPNMKRPRGLNRVVLGFLGG